MTNPFERVVNNVMTQVGRAAGNVVGGMVRDAGNVLRGKTSEVFRDVAPLAAGYPKGGANATPAIQAAKQLPEQFDLSQSRSLSSLVEHSLVALGHLSKGMADGNLDGRSLAALNTFRSAYQQPTATSFAEFTRNDLTAMLDAMGRTPNTEKTKILTMAPGMIQRGMVELPAPTPAIAAPAAAPPAEEDRRGPAIQP